MAVGVEPPADALVWYLTRHGKNTVIWPRTTFAFRQLLGRFDVAAYDVEAHVSESATAEVSA